MKSKITLSIHKETIAKAKKLARKRNTTVSQIVEDYIESTSKIDEKLREKEKISGIIDADLSADKRHQYLSDIYTKQGWK